MIYPSRNDLVSAIQNPALLKETSLKQAILQRGTGNRLIIYSGGFTSVFPALHNGQKYALRCWVADPGDVASNLLTIQSFVRVHCSKYFTEFEYVKDAIVVNGNAYPIMKMAWIDGLTLKHFLAKNIANSTAILKVAENFKVMCSELHNANISHGDLQHGNILVLSNLELKLVDYDGIYVQGLENSADIIKGLPGYQHPSRWNLIKLSPKSDYFSELVIYISLKALSIKPQLWTELNIEDSDTLIFSEEDIRHKGNTNIFKILKQLSPEIEKLTEQLIENLYESDLDKLKPIEAVCREAQKAPWENKTQKIVTHVSKVEVTTQSISNKW